MNWKLRLALWVELCPPDRHVGVLTLFGNKVSADGVEFREVIGAGPTPMGWVSQADRDQRQILKDRRVPCEDTW